MASSTTSGYGRRSSPSSRRIDATFTATEIDALAAAYPYLDFQHNPVGLRAVQVRVATRPGESVEYEANDEYFLGAPAIQELFIPIIKDDIAGGQALAAGQVDWKYSLDGPDVRRRSRTTRT